MGDQSALVLRELNKDSWRWALGIVYIVAVASIWIAASYIVQTVVDEGVSPFLLSYICNSLFVVYIPIAEISRYLGDSVGNLLAENHNEAADFSENEDLLIHTEEFSTHTSNADKQLDSKGRWPRARVAKVSLLVCPFWFFAQLAFNLSLKYTTVTSNTILSSTSSLFTFLVSVAFLGENFSWLKLLSVFLCMGGTVIVSLADLGVGLTAIASNPVLGDVFALVSACFYAVYISLIRKKLPDETKGEGHASMTQFLGYLGLFNFIIFLPVALVLHFTKIESFHNLTWSQFTLIVGKGLIDNALGDFLWAKAILLTSTTVATAGLTIQVPIAAIVDSIVGRAPHLLDYVGAAFVILGFVGINISS